MQSGGETTVETFASVVEGLLDVTGSMAAFVKMGGQDQPVTLTSMNAQ